MGFDIAGLIVNRKMDQQEIETALGVKLQAQSEIDFDGATSTYRDENTIDILGTDTGTLMITGMTQIYELDKFPADCDVMQFIGSETSDTYYLEFYSKGQLHRKYITSQGETAEDTGTGVIQPGDDLFYIVWDYAGQYLQNGFKDNMFEQTFQHFQLES